MYKQDILDYLFECRSLDWLNLRGEADAHAGKASPKTPYLSYRFGTDLLTHLTCLHLS